jgi:hypothetical protein
MSREPTGASGLLHHFDEARKLLKQFAIRGRSWGTFNNNRLVHDGFNRVVGFLHSDQDDLDRRDSMLKAFAERVAVVTKGMTDPQQIQLWKEETLEHYDITVEELDAFASEVGTPGYPAPTPTA